MPKRHSRSSERRPGQAATAGAATTAPAGRGASALVPFVGPIVVLVAFVALAAWSWRKWPDVLVDFGWQLYIPWQVSEGRVLYRDLATLYGPLSAYFNAALFRAFGTSLTTLVVANLIILAATAALVYGRVARACDRLTATVACLVLLALFGFSQYTVIGNYNFICPYSHEATHGLVFALGALACLDVFAIRSATCAIFLAGLCLGLAALTKPEAAAAGLAAAGLGLVMMCARGAAQRPRARDFVLLLGGLVLPGMVFFLYFATQMDAAQAARGTLGAWVTLVGGGWVADNLFHLSGMGLDEPWANLGRLLAPLGAFGLLATGAAGLDVALPRRARNPWLVAGLAVALALILFLVRASLHWDQAARPLPVLALAMLGVALAGFRRQRLDPEQAPRWILLAMISAFSAVLLVKMVLYARVFHYGFTLALPATLLAVVAAVWMVPAALARRARGTLFRALALGVIAAAVEQHLEWSNSLYRLKNFPVGSGDDQILAFAPGVDPRGPLVAEALRRIVASAPRGGSLLVLPEGAGMNYWTRRANPSPYANFMVPEMRAFGEDTILAALKAHPPDVVALVDKDTREFGVGFFGSDPTYGRQILDWVRGSYRPIGGVGAEPFQGGAFGIRLLQRVGATDVN